MSDFVGSYRRRLDEAWLIVVLLFIAFFHGFAMTPLMQNVLYPMRGWLYMNVFGFDIGRKAGMTVIMILSFIVVVGLYGVLCWSMTLVNANSRYRLKDYFVSLSYPLIILAIAYHLSHSLTHLVYEVTKIVPLVSDPLGFGWDLFGTADTPLTMLIPMNWCWWIQYGMIVAGMAACGWQARRVVDQMCVDRKKMVRFRATVLLFLWGMSVVSLYLLVQPMVMMTSV